MFSVMRPIMCFSWGANGNQQDHSQTAKGKDALHLFALSNYQRDIFIRHVLCNHGAIRPFDGD